MPDMIHGFANTPGVGRRSREAMLEVSSLVRGMLEIEPAAATRGASAGDGAGVAEGVRETV